MADQELMADAATFKSHRRCINETIKILQDNKVPYWIDGGGVGEILKPLLPVTRRQRMQQRKSANKKSSRLPSTTQHGSRNFRGGLRSIRSEALTAN